MQRTSLEQSLTAMKHKPFVLISLMLFIAAACTHSPRSIENSATLTAGDSICLPIDNYTHYLSKAMFQFEENGHEYLFFLNRKSANKIHIYDLENRQLLKTIPLQKEGKDGMPNVRGGYPLDSNHFIITSGIGRFWLVNGSGEIDRSYNLWKEGVDFNTFDHIIYLSYLHRPAILKDSVIYFAQEALNYPRSANDWKKIPMFAYANLSSGETGWTELYYPPVFDRDEINPLTYEPEISYTYTGREVVVSFRELDNIFVSSDFKHKREYNAKSRFLPHAHPTMTDMNMDLTKSIRQKGMRPNYHHLLYDKYREVFYRFALMPDENIQPFAKPLQQEFSVIILNKEFEIIGEVKFPGNTYLIYSYFIGKKGLYISENNENNPNFDENKLVFRCFTLKYNPAKEGEYK